MLAPGVANAQGVLAGGALGVVYSTGNDDVGQPYYWVSPAAGHGGGEFSGQLGGGFFGGGGNHLQSRYPASWFD